MGAASFTSSELPADIAEKLLALMKRLDIITGRSTFGGLGTGSMFSSK